MNSLSIQINDDGVGSVIQFHLKLMTWAAALLAIVGVEIINWNGSVFAHASSCGLSQYRHLAR